MGKIIDDVKKDIKEDVAAVKSSVKAEVAKAEGWVKKEEVIVKNWLISQVPGFIIGLLVGGLIIWFIK